MRVLPDSYLRCMTPEARQALGQRTAEEVMANGVATSEKALQKAIVGLLRLKGVEPNVSAMHKRTTHRVGWPDITFAVWDVRRNSDTACLWEIKMPKGELSDAQKALRSKLLQRPNAWRIRTIRSVDQAIAALREMGIS